jgi:hypothetical protein
VTEDATSSESIQCLAFNDVRRWRLRLADEPLEWRAFPGFRGLARLSVLVD